MNTDQKIPKGGDSNGTNKDFNRAWAGATLPDIASGLLAAHLFDPHRPLWWYMVGIFFVWQFSSKEFKFSFRRGIYAANELHLKLLGLEGWLQEFFLRWPPHPECILGITYFTAIVIFIAVTLLAI